MFLVPFYVIEKQKMPGKVDGTSWELSEFFSICDSFIFLNRSRFYNIDAGL